MPCWVEGVSPGRLGTRCRPGAQAPLEEDLTGIRNRGTTVLVSLLGTGEAASLGLEREGEMAARAGMQFRSFPITDHGLPSDDVAALAECATLARLVEAGEGVAIHCFAGIGRATIIGAGTLVHLGWEPERALQAIGRARGLSVPDTEHQRRWVLTLPDLLR